MKRIFAATLVALALPMSPLAAQDDLAARFGARPTVLDMSMSPSGTKIAFLAPGDQYEDLLYTIDLSQGTPPRPVAIDGAPNGRLTHCDWAGEEYLICNFYGTSNARDLMVGFSRLMLVAADGSGVRMLETGNDHRSMSYGTYGGSVLATSVDGQPNQVLVQTFQSPRFNTGTRVGSDDYGVIVNLINLETLAETRVMQPREAVTGYMTDETGTIRAMGTMSRGGGGYNRDEQMGFSVRPADSGQFVSLVPDRPLEDWWVTGINAAQNTAYVMGDEGGYTGLYAMPLDGSNTTTPLLNRPGFDIDGTLRIGRFGRIIGGTYASERRQFEYFDRSMRSLTNALGAALPGEPQVEIVGGSRDEQRLLVLAYSDVNPGTYYLLEQATGELSEILPARRELAGTTLSPMQPITYPARDGVMIPGYLTLPPGSDGRGLPAIVMPHGGPSSRDEWGFDWMVQFFAQNGYAVLQPNFRGSTGYGEAWEMENGFQSWRTAVADVADAGRWLAAEGIADPARLAVMGWSYGGYAALQVEASEADVFAAIVAVAPVTDLGRLREEARNYSNYPEVSEFLGNGAHVSSGSPARNAEQFNSPVLLVHAEGDQSVEFEQSRLMRDALRDEGRAVTLLSFPELDHSIFDSEDRATMLRTAAEFLATALGTAQR